MKILNGIIRTLLLFRIRVLMLLVMASAAAPGAFGTEITNLDTAADGDVEHIRIDLTAPINPIVRPVDKAGRLILDFPNVSLRIKVKQHDIVVNHNGISEVFAKMSEDPSVNSRIIVWLDSVRPFEIKTSDNGLILTIYRHPQVGGANAANQASISTDSHQIPDSSAESDGARKLVAALPATSPPEVEHVILGSMIDEPVDNRASAVRHRFKIKFVSGNTVYIDGGSRSGLRVGMNLDIWTRSPGSHQSATNKMPVVAAHIVGVATTSAILQIGNSSADLQVGDWAELHPRDADTARNNVLTGPDNTLHASSRSPEEDGDSLAAPVGRSFQAEQAPDELATRAVGRIGFDYSGISSSGSTPGTSTQIGMSFQSNIKHIMGTHWNLEGYWRGRTNQHSQFREATIEETLNKTYTMQLYYDNPSSKWVAGLGRLYLPWAVSLDTIDGGYLGFKSRGGMTTGVFAGSTPDLTSWHYRPDQRIGGVFTNFEGGDYDRFHYSSTSGLGLSSIGWKLDRPFLFFENEASYKGKVSVFHSLIADSPQGVSTDGIRPGAGVSHSYFTLHYQPKNVVSFDVYHNFFRDVPTAATAIVGTGLVDKLLFQGISAGTHVKPTRHLTLYTTLGTSEKTGDERRSLNQMYGATWNEIARSGLRADFHYSKFDSNFGKGDYSILSLSRQLTSRMFWNLQFGNQNLLSEYSDNYNSKFVADSLDINLGRHSYLQSGYTYVDGVTLNYRQWYLSWGYRIDQGKRNPEYVNTLGPQH
jgi:AMIN domain